MDAFEEEIYEENERGRKREVESLRMICGRGFFL